MAHRHDTLAVTVEIERWSVTVRAGARPDHCAGGVLHERPRPYRDVWIPEATVEAVRTAPDHAALRELVWQAIYEIEASGDDAITVSRRAW
jgi:hypothetical protein